MLFTRFIADQPAWLRGKHELFSTLDAALVDLLHYFTRGCFYNYFDGTPARIFSTFLRLVWSGRATTSARKDRGCFHVDGPGDLATRLLLAVLSGLSRTAPTKRLACRATFSGASARSASGNTRKLDRISKARTGSNRCARRSRLLSMRAKITRTKVPHGEGARTVALHAKDISDMVTVYMDWQVMTTNKVGWCCVFARQIIPQLEERHVMDQRSLYLPAQSCGAANDGRRGRNSQEFILPPLDHPSLLILGFPEQKPTTRSSSLIWV